MSTPSRDTADPGGDSQTPGRSLAGGFSSIRRHALGIAAVSTALAAPAVMWSRGFLAVILAVAAVAAAIAFIPSVRVGEVLKRFRNPLPAMTTITMALWLVSLLVGINLEWSLFVWSTTAGLLLITGLIHAAFETEDWVLPYLLRTLVAASLAFVIAGTVAIWVWHGMLDPIGIRGITDVRLALKSYGSFIPCLVIAVVWAGFRLGGVWRAAAILYAGLGLAMIQPSEARSGWLGLIVAGIALAATWVWLRLHRRARLLFAAAVAASIVAGGVGIVTALPKPLSPGPMVFRIPDLLVDHHRQIIWGFVLQHSAKAPILGVGPGNARNLPGAKKGIVEIGTYVPSHPHNWFIQVFAETGVVGLAALLAVLFILLQRLVRAAGSGNRAGWAGIGVTAAFFGSWFSNFSFWAAWWQASYLLLMVMILVSIAQDAGPSARTE